MKYSQVQQWNRMLPLKYKKIWDLTIKYSTRFCYNLWSLCASRFMGSLIISSSESQRDLCLFLNNEFLMFYRKKIFFSKFLIGIEFIQQIVFFQFFSIQHNIFIHVCTSYGDVDILTSIQVIVHVLLSLFIATAQKVCVVAWRFVIGSGGGDQLRYIQ